MSYTKINAIGLIDSTHIGLQSSEKSSVITDNIFYDLFKINSNSLSRLNGNNSVWTSNGVPMYRIDNINVVISTSKGLICHIKPFVGVGNIAERYNTLIPSGSGYDITQSTVLYSQDYNNIDIQTYSTPIYNKNKEALYIALVKNIRSLSIDHNVVNSPLLIFNKVFEVSRSKGIYSDILSKDIHQDTSAHDIVESIIAVSTDGNLILTYIGGAYTKLKNLKLYDLTNNSVSEYIP